MRHDFLRDWRKMGLPKEEINVIARGAFLHDIGKMAIPDAILLKPRKPTEDEIAIMLREANWRPPTSVPPCDSTMERLIRSPMPVGSIYEGLLE